MAVTFGVLPWAAAVHLVVTLGSALYVIPPDRGLLPRLWPFLSDEFVWRGAGSDVTEVKLQSDEIVRMGRADALTGMPNRHSFWTGLERLLHDPYTSESRLALAMLDLDNFKSVNDTLRHTVGNAVLREVADRLSEAGGVSQLFARLGGDEFAILFTDVGDSSHVRTLLGRYIEALHDPITVAGTRLEIGYSIGYCRPDALPAISRRRLGGPSRRGVAATTE